jgi:hypothetical protein
MDDEIKTKKTRKKRKLYKRLIILFVVIVIVGAIAYELHKLSQPEMSQVSETQGAANSTDYDIDLTPTPETGAYASFDYPKGMHLISSATEGGGSVEDYDFYVKDISSWTLAIGVTKTPTGLLSESSAYVLRKDNPSTYAESQMLVNGQEVDVMTDTTMVGGFSKVAFLAHGVLVATVSLVGGDSSGNKPLQTTFDMVLNSWHWQ